MNRLPEALQLSTSCSHISSLNGGYKTTPRTSCISFSSLSFHQLSGFALLFRVIFIFSPKAYAPHNILWPLITSSLLSF